MEGLPHPVIQLVIHDGAPELGLLVCHWLQVCYSVSMRRCWQGVHRCMVGSRVVVPILIIHVGIVVVRLVRWWWCARW